MKTKITKMLTVSLLMILGFWNVNAQTFVWDKSELTTSWANGADASTIKSQGGVTLKQIRTAGVVATNSYIDIANTNATLLVNSASSDAVTITSASDNITSIKITYSSNGSTSTTNPYVGYNATPTTLGEGEITATALVSSCEMTNGVTGNVGVEQTYTPPAGTKYAIIVRGASCGATPANITTTRIYRVEVFTSSVIPTIAAFSALGVDATIDKDAKTITAELPYGTNLTAITPTVTIGGTAISYSPTGAQNFSAGAVTYTATDGSVNTAYAVTLTTSTTASNDATLSDLKVDGTTVASFNPATLTYDVALPFVYSGKPVISATVNDAAASVTYSQVASIPGSATATVIAQDKSQKVYTVNFTRIPASSACDLTSFSINTKAGVITEQNILVKMSLTTNVTNLTPVLAVSNLATYAPLGAQNFTNPVNYIVTAEDGTKKTYIVTVQLVDMTYNGPFPYETNFPSGYQIPDWMSSPTLGGITFNDPYGSGTTGSDKVVWYDNQAEIDATTASVVRLSTASSIEFFLSKCKNITAQLSATGTRTYRLYVNDELKVTSAPTAKDTKATLNYNVNLNEPVVIKINTVETTGGATLGYLKIDDSLSSGLAQINLSGITFDGKTIWNENNVSIQVYNVLGRMVVFSEKSINMATYPKGIYLVKSNTDTMKIVLNK